MSLKQLVKKVLNLYEKLKYRPLLEKLTRTQKTVKMGKNRFKKGKRFFCVCFCVFFFKEEYRKIWQKQKH